MQAKEASSPVDPTIVTADNTFGLNLLNTLIQNNSGSNTAIAPLSVAIALQIAYNGAAGTTQQAMAQTLQLGNLSVPQLNGDNAALQASLLDPDPKVDLTIANSLWVHLSAYPLASTFVSTDSVDLSLPRFTTSFGASLQQSLTALGMDIAFDPGQGNLSGIYPGAFISDVEHKTVVEVNETGTVAVGVTSVGVGATAVQDSVNFTINHPFFYAIRDNTSGDLLFVGVLMNPGAG
jgi:serine protease inhibitor